MIDYETDLMQVEDRRVVLLQSGGLDTCYLACLLHKCGFTINHVFVDYGQNARDRELEAAQKIAKEYGGGEVHVVKLDMPWLHDSTLLAGHEVEEYDVPNQFGCVLAGTYVPMRNHILISIASSLAEAKGIKYIASAIDGNEDVYGHPLTGCPDKHPSFCLALEESLSEGSSLRHLHGENYEIIAPLMGNKKENTISYGLEIGCDFSLSWSCYNSEKEPCGKCCACIDRANHFANLGVDDPALKK